MDWGEFCDLLNGLNESTPLVRVVQIRTETDKEVLKEFTPDQRRMNSEWQKRAAFRRSKEEVDQFIKSMQRVFQGMSGEA